MDNKKQKIGYWILISVSVLFIISYLFLPMIKIISLNVFTKEPDYNGSLSIIQFLKSSILIDNDNLFTIFTTDNGPAWLSFSTVYFNFLTAIAFVFVLVSSIVGLCKIDKTISEKNSVTSKISMFAGIFGTCVFALQIAGFVLISSYGQGDIYLKLQVGNFVCGILSICSIYASTLVKDKSKILNKNSKRDAIFYLTTAILSLISVILLFYTRFFKRFMSLETIPELYKQADYISENQNICATAGLSGIFLFLVTICYTFTFVYSIIGFIMSLKNKESRFLSIRVRRWSKSALVTFSILFCFIISVTVTHNTNLSILYRGKYIFAMVPASIFAFVMPIITTILTRFIGIPEKKIKNKNLIEDEQKNLV